MKDQPQLCETKRSDFLHQHGLTCDDFAKTGLTWDEIDAICEHHVSQTPELKSVAEYLSARLQTVSEVHSLKTRIKAHTHLAAKLIRKKLDKPELNFDLSNYDQQITDLIGVRALHLFKAEWHPIHEFVTQQWELAEKPIANIRAGDPEDFRSAFEAAGCEVKEHPFGYRSIHYLVKSQPAKRAFVGELQVRTIFEEGWSEIDHRVRYPRLSDDPYLAQFLTIFNRLAGSSDEMGTFVRGLSELIHQHAARVSEKEKQTTQLESQLKLAISKLEISKKDKEGLERQISELRKHSQRVEQSTVGDSFSKCGLLGSTLNLLNSSSYSKDHARTSAIVSIAGLLNIKTCAKCGRAYQESPVSVLSAFQDKCPDCRESTLLSGLK